MGGTTRNLLFLRPSRKAGAPHAVLTCALLLWFPGTNFAIRNVVIPSCGETSTNRMSFRRSTMSLLPEESAFSWLLRVPHTSSLRVGSCSGSQARGHCIKMTESKMTESVTIRSAETADFARITQLLRDGGLPLDGIKDHENFLVLCRHSRVIGCAAIERYAPYGLLRSVALEPQERRHGLGGRLVQEAMQQARRDGLAELILLTTTATPFFERLGFRVISRAEVPVPVRASVEFQSACPASATVMRLVL